MNEEMNEELLGDTGSPTEYDVVFAERPGDLILLSKSAMEDRILEMVRHFNDETGAKITSIDVSYPVETFSPYFSPRTYDTQREILTVVITATIV